MPHGAHSWLVPGYDELSKEWASVSASLKDRDEPRAFLDKWREERRRAFAIETGQIEGLYTLKAGITEQLIAEGLAGVVQSHTVENVEDRTIKGLLADQETAYNMLFEDVASGRPLTQHAVKTWHQLVTRHQETVAGLTADGRRVQVPFRRKGMWKNHPNNPRRPDGVMHEYCPPEVVQDEMDRFFALHAQVERERYPVYVEAAWMHHRFVRTHPFQDGNGRVSRMLMAYAFIRRGEPPPVITAGGRNDYIDALDIANTGDLRAFSDYLADVATVSLRAAVRLGQRVLAGNTHMTDYEPPRDIWEVNATLRFDEPLNGDQDPRWVDTHAARGDASLDRLMRVMGVDITTGQLRKAPERGYYLFCGHRGSGKSTELRHIRNQLNKPNIYHVVLADAALELDVNNLRYQDILFHLAGKLAESLNERGVHIDSVHLRKLDDWFTERVAKSEKTRSFATEARAGVDARLSILGLARVFAHVSTTLRTNTIHKDELRRTLRNYFSDFANAFNHLIEVAQSKLGQPILFVVDGTDRLRKDDADAFFNTDIHQLQQIRGIFIYCAPVHLTYQSNVLGSNFDEVFHLPMIRVEEKDGSPNRHGLGAMRQMLLRRAHEDLFEPGVVDYLVQHCGGHPRDLLRLLQGAFLHAERERFDADGARRAVRDLGSDFRRMLRPTDYEHLASVDIGQAQDADRSQWLLYNLALLEYNDFYWRSHPAIRETSAYLEAKESESLLGDGGQPAH